MKKREKKEANLKKS